MGLDLQPDGLTAGLGGHCQPDKKYKGYKGYKKKAFKVTRLQE